MHRVAGRSVFGVRRDQVGIFGDIVDGPALFLPLRPLEGDRAHGPLADLDVELAGKLGALFRKQQKDRGLDRELRADLLETQFEPERLREAVGAFGQSGPQPVDPPHVFAASHLEVIAFGRDQRDVADFGPCALDVKTAEDDRSARGVQAFEVPGQLGPAARRRFEVDLDEAGPVDVGRRIFFRVGDVFLLPADRAEAGRNPHADRGDRPLLGIDRLHDVQLDAVPVHRQRALAGDVEDGPGPRLVHRDVPREVELPLDAVGLDPRAMRDRRGKDVGVFDRLDLAVLLRHAERDLTSGGGGNRQLQVPLIELAANRHHEGHEEFVHPLAAEINRVTGDAIDVGLRAKFARARLPHAGDERTLWHADRHGDPHGVALDLDLELGRQLGPLVVAGTGDRDRTDAVIELVVVGRLFRAEEFLELLERGPVKRPFELSVLGVEPDGVARPRSEDRRIGPIRAGGCGPSRREKAAVSTCAERRARRAAPPGPKRKQPRGARRRLPLPGALRAEFAPKPSPAHTNEQTTDAAHGSVEGSTRPEADGG